MRQDLEHPVITHMCRSGHPDGIEPPRPTCPECGAEDPETLYRRIGDNEVLGCDHCIKADLQ